MLNTPVIVRYIFENLESEEGGTKQFIGRIRTQVQRNETVCTITYSLCSVLPADTAALCETGKGTCCSTPGP